MHLPKHTPSVARTLRPKELIVGLLFASPNGELDVAALIRAGAIFKLQANSIRVTLARLLADNRIESPNRGVYRLGQNSRRLAQEAARWRKAETRIRPWTGHFLFVCTGHLPASDRTAVLLREKSLLLGGFKPLRDGLYVRPDNIDADASTLGKRLHDNGLERDAIMTTGRWINTHADSTLKALWKPDRLNAGYLRDTEALAAWLHNHINSPIEQAAHDSWFLGARAIRSVVYDPLLPSEWIDTTSRHAFFETVKAVDDTGRAIWLRYLAQVSA